ncbi:uncharacterized protein LOC125177926 [Hyalella azteca]|uniref:Uncharacterized protein LOC125177926 n=1 Tax=Hyalella azteca TaxID=294128 RepID=A0A979FIP4_HYAAZ|nr:uncharacterized protein LOC125177926 [Hyalella azteca]
MSTYAGCSNSSAVERKKLLRCAAVALGSRTPKAPLQSPLKLLVQSPDFRLKRQLAIQEQDLKRLYQEVTDLMVEKQEWQAQRGIYERKTARSVRELQKLRQQLEEVERENEIAAQSAADQQARTWQKL